VLVRNGISCYRVVVTILKGIHACFLILEAYNVQIIVFSKNYFIFTTDLRLLKEIFTFPPSPYLDGNQQQV